MKKALFILLLAVATGCHKADTPGGLNTDTDLVTVRFALPGVSAEVSPVSRADADEPLPVHKVSELDEGVTVRVLAFQRRMEGVPAAPAASADIENDTYVAEATYKVVKKSLEVPEGADPQFDYVLVPCNVDPATGKVDETATAKPAELRLRADTYDFHALTPAVAVDNLRKVSIGHGADYAVSCTPGIVLSAATNPAAVELETLERKCCRITFSIDRQAENVKTVDIKSITFSEISESPLTALLGEDLIPGANTGSYVFPAEVFSPVVDTIKYKFVGGDEILPKAEGKFKLSMLVNFNDSKEDSAPEAEIDELTFEAGKQYRFILTLKGDEFVLWLTVLDWDEDVDWEIPIGDWPHLVIQLGKWENISWNEGSGGYFYPVISVDDWIPVTDWGISFPDDPDRL
ncbi:MAG: hypothetical protein K2L09_03080 [Alistipes sp.]|nr:hypothetical protein [Alistipes sp.]